MTPDIEQIRAALAAAAKEDDGEWVDNSYRDRAVLRGNAPVWLAQLCLEVEKLNDLVLDLKAEQKAGQDEVEQLRAVDERLREGIDVVTAQRDAALAECERLRGERIAETGKSAEMYEQLYAECERLREYLENIPTINRLVGESAAWRACAEMFDEGFHQKNDSDMRAACDEYDRLVTLNT